MDEIEQFRRSVEKLDGMKRELCDACAIINVDKLTMDAKEKK